MRYRIDRSVRRASGGRVVLGGSPGRLLRLSEAGADLVDRLASGSEVGRASRGVSALVDRLLDAGMVHPSPEPGSGPYTPADVTVVVPVRDRPEGLRRLLDSLSSGPEVAAVVVVDDGSSIPVDQPEVTVLRHPGTRGPAAARNTGAAAARTPLVAFVDSDCTVEPGWLDSLLGHFQDPRVAAVAPRITPPPVTITTSPLPPPRSRCSCAGPDRHNCTENGRWGWRGKGALEAYDRDRSPLDLGDEPGRVEPGSRISYVPSAALLVRRDAFDAAGGFDEEMRVGEDVDLVWRLVQAGHRVRYEPRSLVRHEVRPGLRQWLTQRFGYGTSAAALDARHPGGVPPVAASGWSVGLWTLAALGHPVLAASVAAGTVVSMDRRLRDVPRGEVARLVVGGHLASGRQLARATVREWWPIALALSVANRRSRRLALVAVAVTLGEARRRSRGSGSLDPLTFAALTLADEIAYGAGVWVGCGRQRSLRALLPRIAVR